MNILAQKIAELDARMEQAYETDEDMGHLIAEADDLAIAIADELNTQEGIDEHLSDIETVMMRYEQVWVGCDADALQSVANESNRTIASQWFASFAANWETRLNEGLERIFSVLKPTS